MSGLFITGTGTGVGKTLVTAALAWQLQQQKRQVVALKPVLSGLEDEGENDATILVRVQPEQTLEAIAPWRFKAPLSPNIAAAMEGREIDPAALVDFCKTSIAQNALTLVEGVGGSHVPLAKDFLVADWIAHLGLPAVVVTGNYLGSLSDTLSTLEALTARKIHVSAVVLSEANDPAMDLTKTRAALIDQSPSLDILLLNRITESPLWENANDLTGLVKSL